jgi:RimJ/RimL family protein N-acetyltransferase
VEGLRLERWSAGDLWLVKALNGDPGMTRYLGGPESAAKLAERQARYEQPDSGMFKIMLGDAPVGSVGYWERGDVFEVGWAVLPEFQRRGIGRAGTAAALDLARAERRHQFVHAYPAVANAASNAICRSLGFTLLGAQEFEYPPGNMLRCNDWRLELY